VELGWEILLAVSIAGLAFMLSASAGLGGSLILIPAMILLVGAKEGIAISAVLLGCNNLAKVIVYRRTIPIKLSLVIFLMTVLGAAVGANLLLRMPEVWIEGCVVLAILASFLLERAERRWLGKNFARVLAFFAGATSGFAGTSGPLKGIVLRSLNLDRFHLVGAASLVSLGGDATKAVIFTRASLLGPEAWLTIFCALPLIPVAALLGRYLNREMGERAYTGLFWLVMGGYTVRLLAS
jgi:uncharacterized membrane protein YfcA